MRNPDLTRLREAVRAEIAQAFKSVGFARPRDIARQVCADHPENISALGGRLAEDALTDLARRELKHNCQQRESPSQMTLPGVPEALASQLPPAISIPAGADGDDEGVIYKPLVQATLAELEAHLTLLSTQIAADTHRHRALKELRDLALAAGATRDSGVLRTIGATKSTLAELANCALDHLPVPPTLNANSAHGQSAAGERHE
ncbi:MAG: hypothetical protein HO274_02555 [Ferrovum myxofaciens]|uniref:hypothetical protein n=1 Tax=Ferrovum myxofaciens TaxID=416213 RepID=UPI00235429E9|nr:hypothetical protein [Ferrovum myxofaciens]QKE40334.1 MAG: hypothetical protein HO274_02555 [Ferrovum myxofaciens]